MKYQDHLEIRHLEVSTPTHQVYIHSNVPEGTKTCCCCYSMSVKRIYLSLEHGSVLVQSLSQHLTSFQPFIAIGPPKVFCHLCYQIIFVLGLDCNLKIKSSMTKLILKISLFYSSFKKIF
jgi:hypothetical protein